MKSEGKKSECKVFSYTFVQFIQKFLPSKGHQHLINTRYHQTKYIEEKKIVNVYMTYLLVLSCRLLLGLRVLTAATNHTIAVVVGIARCAAMGAALGGNTSSLFIITIVIVVLIHIHLPRGRFVRRGLFRAGCCFFLDLSRRWARLGAIGRRGRVFGHRRKTRAPLVRRHILDGWERWGVVGRLGRMVFFVHTALFFTSSFRRAAALHLPRGRHVVGGCHATGSLFVKTSTALLVGNLFDRAFCFPVSGTLHS